MTETFLNGRVTLHSGDCLDVLATLPENSIDSCVTDPPYHLVSIYKRFANEARNEKTVGNGAYGRHATGFMGKQWDGGDIAFRPETWAAVYRVLKPGAHLIAFGGTRTYGRMQVAIENAGFEVRDTVAWMFGQGFPKSHDVSKGIDRTLGAEREMIPIGDPVKRMIPGADQNKAGWEKNNGREYVPNKSIPATDAARRWQGWGTALKPGMELLCLARKPLEQPTVAANVLKWGTGAINVDGCRVEGDGNKTFERDAGKRSREQYRTGTTIGMAIPSNMGRWPANVILDGSEEVVGAFPETQTNSTGNHHTGEYGSDGVTGWKQGAQYGGDSGSAARFFYQVKQDDPCNPNVGDAARCSLRCRPQNGDTAQSNVADSTTLKIAPTVKYAGSLCDSCAIVIAQSLVAMRRGQSPASAQFRDFIGERNAQILSRCLALYAEGRESTDTILTIPSLKQLFGSVFHAIATCIEGKDCEQEIAPEKFKRFWYTSKADTDDRLGSKHPTVKPLDLMQYLVRLVTPKGATCLDPFAGTGTTGEAAWREGMRAVLIEREPEYQADIRRRMALCLSGPNERARESIKAKRRGKPVDHGPLFNAETN